MSTSLKKFCKVFLVMLIGMTVLIASMGLVNAVVNGLITGIYAGIGLVNLCIGGIGTYAVYRRLFRKG